MQLKAQLLCMGFKITSRHQMILLFVHLFQSQQDLQTRYISFFLRSSKKKVHFYFIHYSNRDTVLEVQMKCSRSTPFADLIGFMAIRNVKSIHTQNYKEISYLFFN